jgi:DNA-binding IclR family transcriptional regulator
VEQTIKILEKTIRLLAAFSPARGEWGVSELSAELGLPKSTVHRIARVLAAHHYLSRAPGTGRLRLGLAALELGRTAQEGLELARVSHAVLERLAAESGETVLLMVLDETRDRAVCIARAESRMHLRLILEVGTSAPLHAGSSSKVLLAHMAAEEIERVIAAGLPRLARGTITRPDVLRRDLAQTRVRGYARSVEETNEGAAGLAVPIFDARGGLLAGLSIVGPLARFGERQVPRLLHLAHRGVGEIRRALGLPPLAGPSRRPLAARPAPAERVPVAAGGLAR